MTFRGFINFLGNPENIPNEHHLGQKKEYPE